MLAVRVPRSPVAVLGLLGSTAVTLQVKPVKDQLLTEPSVTDLFPKLRMFVISLRFESVGSASSSSVKLPGDASGGMSPFVVKPKSCASLGTASLVILISAGKMTAPL